MPMLLPYAYIVSYDLNQPLDKYGPFFEELKRSHKWCHYLTTMWIVLRHDALVELAIKLKPLLFQTDRLLIMQAKGPADGWLPPDAWKWIQENVPKEW